MWNGLPHKPPQRPAAIEQAHPCPVQGCVTLCSPGHVVCRPHWRAIPYSLRDPLITAFRHRAQDPVGYALACARTRTLAQHYSAMCAFNGR